MVINFNVNNFSKINSFSILKGKHQINIDKILMKIKFPSEFPRTQRSIKDIDTFKANEYRNLVFYSLVYVLKPFLKVQYYNHFLLYVVFIRLLTQNSIKKEDIRYSRKLIHSFMSNFQTLYGDEHLSFNLHGHLHLPDQVELFGPLNKISCFSFEGVFKICKRLFNGTRGITSQIANNLNISSYLYFDAEQITEQISNNKLKQLLKNITGPSSLKANGTCLLSPIDEIEIKEIPKQHLAPLGNTVGLSAIKASSNASIRSFGKILLFLFKYSFKLFFLKCMNHTEKKIKRSKIILFI